MRFTPRQFPPPGHNGQVYGTLQPSKTRQIVRCLGMLTHARSYFPPRGRLAAVGGPSGRLAEGRRPFGSARPPSGRLAGGRRPFGSARGRSAALRVGPASSGSARGRSAALRIGSRRVGGPHTQTHTHTQTHIHTQTHKHVKKSLRSLQKNTELV